MELEGLEIIDEEKEKIVKENIILDKTVKNLKKELEENKKENQ